MLTADRSYLAGWDMAARVTKLERSMWPETQHAVAGAVSSALRHQGYPLDAWDAGYIDGRMSAVEGLVP